jgi:hypothetical protein
MKTKLHFWAHGIRISENKEKHRHHDDALHKEQTRWLMVNWLSRNRKRKGEGRVRNGFLAAAWRRDKRCRRFGIACVVQPSQLAIAFGCSI